MRCRTEFTDEELQAIEDQADSYLWELSREDMQGLIGMLLERMTVEDQVRSLSSDEEYVKEILGFDPFQKEGS